MRVSTGSVPSTRLRPTARYSRRRPSGRRSPAMPRPGLVRASLVLAGAGLGATTALTITAETWSQVTARGGLATFAGNITGMVGTYLALIMVLLVSRIPFAEHVLGQDGLLRWHRRLGPWPISLLIAHALPDHRRLRGRARTGVWHQVGAPHPLLSGRPGRRGWPRPRPARGGVGPGHPAAPAAGGLVDRPPVLYLALAFSFAHVIMLGQSFVGRPLTQAVWSVAWPAPAGLVLGYRGSAARGPRRPAPPARRRVGPRGPAWCSVLCRGRDLDGLPVSGAASSSAGAS